MIVMTALCNQFVKKKLLLLVVSLMIVSGCATVSPEPGADAASSRVVESELALLREMAAAQFRPLRWLEGLSQITPNTVYLTSVALQGNKIRVAGKTVGNQDIADMLRKVEHSNVFSNARLTVMEVDKQDSKYNRFILVMQEQTQNMSSTTLVNQSGIENNVSTLTIEERVYQMSSLARQLDVEFSRQGSYDSPDIRIGSHHFKSRSQLVTVTGSYPALVHYFQQLQQLSLLARWDNLGMHSVIPVEGQSATITLTSILRFIE